LSTIKLLAVISIGFAMLHDVGTKLVIRSICVDVKQKVLIRIGTEYICCHHCFHLRECLLHGLCPHKPGLLGAFLRHASFFREWCEDVGTMGPHVAVVIDHTNETSESFQVGWRIHLEDCIYFLFLRLKAGWCQPITEPVHLLDGPVTLK
jgi:hypothetical protein